MKDNLVEYILGLADNNLILGQRLGELCGHGPSLETDIALTNIGLDLFGQVRSYFQYAAHLQGQNASEDSIAFLRQEHEYRNVHLVEQPNTDFGYVITRQFFYDVYHLLLLEELQAGKDETLSAIAAKSVKEVRYHVRFSSDWIKRLGDGTQESHERIQQAVNDLWVFTEELFQQTDTDKKMIEKGIGVDTGIFRNAYFNKLKEVISEATLQYPDTQYALKGGKFGRHSEHMGYLLSEMQYMQRAYPNMNW